MPRRRATLLQGTLDLLILKALAPGPLHGLGVSRRIEQVTRGTFVVQPGSLFPALHRLEEAGWLDSDWQPSTSNYKDYREYAWGEGWKVWVASSSGCPRPTRSLPATCRCGFAMRSWRRTGCGSAGISSTAARPRRLTAAFP